MISYIIRSTLVPAAGQPGGGEPSVTCVTAKEWEEASGLLGLTLDREVAPEKDITKAEVGTESLTGSFSVPSRENLGGERIEFAFATDGTRLVFLDDSGFVNGVLERFAGARNWKKPSLARFLADFLEYLVRDDRKTLQRFESELEQLEDGILEGKNEGIAEEIHAIRGDLLDLRTHYQQLIDFGQELQENENLFFSEEELGFFHLFTARVERYSDQVLALREYTSQIRDLHQSQQEAEQNRNMALLTVVTSIFCPLTLITGWYGMNFVHMPELRWLFSYPALIVICVVIVIAELLFFKKKKWL